MNQLPKGYGGTKDDDDTHGNQEIKRKSALARVFGQRFPKQKRCPKSLRSASWGKRRLMDCETVRTSGNPGSERGAKGERASGTV